MQVKCLTDNLHQLNDIVVQNRLSEWIHLEGPDDNLTLKKGYTVMALEGDTISGFKVYLHTIEHSNHPYPYPIELFQITDSTFPDSWCVGLHQGLNGKAGIRISFPEWANDDLFYELLINGEPAATETYNQHRNTDLIT